MRIAYVNADCGIPVFGEKGASVHIQEMIRAFSGLGCEVRVVATRMGEGPNPDFPAPVLLEPGSGRTEQDPSGREGKERTYLAAAQAVEDRLVALYREWPFDLIYERYSLWSAAGVRAGARLGVPVIAEVNAPLVPEQAAFRKLVLADTAARVEAEVMAGASALACVSGGVAAYAVGRGAARDRVHVIGNAVDTARFRPDVAPDRAGMPPGTFVVGFTGSLKRWHGVDTLLEAFRRVRVSVPEAHLLLVGDGPKRGWVEGFLAGAGLESAVTLTGWVHHARLPGLIAAMDVATAPYPDTEDFYFSPLKLFEYLAVGRPVAASRIGQIAEVMQGGECGMLLPPGDAQALADALVRLARDPALRADLAYGAAAIGACHSWEGNARRVLDLARSIRQAA